MTQKATARDIKISTPETTAAPSICSSRWLCASKNARAANIDVKVARRARWLRRCYDYDDTRSRFALSGDTDLPTNHFRHYFMVVAPRSFFNGLALHLNFFE